MKLSAHQSSQYTKVLYIGDSGTGKTGSLVSLVKAGYNLRILDMDNGLDALLSFIQHECPDRVDAVDFETLRDEMTMSPVGPVIRAKAYVAAIKLLNKWTDDSVPAEGGDKEIFVVDSLTSLGKACFEWAKASAPGAKDPRQWYFAAQQSLENVIGMLTSSNFETNVIVISHINYKELEEGVHKGYPSAVGSAMGPTVPKYFNTMIQAEVRGSGKNTKRTLRTIPTSVLDLKNPKPFTMEAEYDLGTGLAEIFETLRKAA